MIGRAGCVDNSIQYYSREMLRLRQDIPGARMWAVALDKTMLTYFEVQPNSRFETHRHTSEQITLVLEGVLFFQSDDKVTSVRAGEVIAIPSNVSHAAFTRDEVAKAIDAWSPVMEQYRK